MIKLFDFNCKKCGRTEEHLVDYGELPTCGRCHITMDRIFTPTRGIRTYDSDFNPHYDMQLGRHFQDADEKKKFLKDTGRTQCSGLPSPKRDNKTSIKCTKAQAKKEFGISPKKKAEYYGQGEET